MWLGEAAQQRACGWTTASSGTGVGCEGSRGEAHGPEWRGTEVVDSGARRATLNHTWASEQSYDAQRVCRHPGIPNHLPRPQAPPGSACPPPRNPAEFFLLQLPLVSYMLRVPGPPNPNAKGCRDEEARVQLFHG